MKYKKLTDIEKSAIVQAVQNGVREDLRDFKMENRLASYNCRHSIKWDFINTNIERKLNSKRLDSKIINRKIWEFPVIYDNEGKVLYVIMRKKNFFTIQHNRNNRKAPHYIDAFATYNADIGILKEQIELFNTDREFEEEQINEVLNLLGEYKEKVDRFLIGVFQEENSEIVEFKTYLVDKNLTVSEAEIDDWSHLITPKFDLAYSDNTSEDSDIKTKNNPTLLINPKKNKKSKNK